MPKLIPHELESRLRFDWQITQRMSSPLVAIKAFKSMSELKNRKRPMAKEENAHRAVAYLVEYRIRSLISAGKFHDRFDVSIDVLASGNYPFAAPACSVISRPIPWSPHFLASTGSICLGELWASAKGSITLGHLILHVAKLLNFDEPDREPSYGGWNPAAVKYWRQVMKREPITKGLVYPVLPPEFTHGLGASNRPVFRPASTPTPVKPAQSLFRPVGR